MYLLTAAVKKTNSSCY